jgi:sugar phosphate isomerase/epimerase
LHRIHVKATRNLQNRIRTYWGGMYPMQAVNPELARQINIPMPGHSWDRHNYEAMLPGFGGSDSMDWRLFVETLQEKNFTGPFEIENEARNSKDTGNMGAIVQGFTGAIYSLSPMLWPLSENGYQYNKQLSKPLQHLTFKDIPEVTMDGLV